MKRKLTIKLKPINVMKETPEERLERIRNQKTYTRVVPSKKIYSRKKLPKVDLP